MTNNQALLFLRCPLFCGKSTATEFKKPDGTCIQSGIEKMAEKLKV